MTPGTAAAALWSRGTTQLTPEDGSAEGSRKPGRRGGEGLSPHRAADPSLSSTEEPSALSTLPSGTAPRAEDGDHGAEGAGRVTGALSHTGPALALPNNHGTVSSHPRGVALCWPTPRTAKAKPSITGERSETP